MPGNRKRAHPTLAARMTGPACQICPAGPGTGCDYYHADTETLVQVGARPPLFAHAARMAAATAGHPALRRMALARFGDGTVPAELTSPEPPAPPPPEPGNAGWRRDPAGYRSSASRRAPRDTTRGPRS